MSRITWLWLLGPFAALAALIGCGSDKGRVDAGRTGDGSTEASASSDGSADLKRDGGPSKFVRVAAGLFVFPGKAAGGFIGVNSAGLSHYGTPALKWSTAAQVDEQLSGIQAIGGRAVRVFAAANDADAATQATRLGALLDGAKAKGIYVIAALTDFYATAYHPTGDDGAYAVDPNGFTVLNDAWFKGGYKTNYQPWVDKVVTALRDHPALLTWELGNELKNLPDPSAFVTFASTMAQRIRGIDPNHLITTGVISTRNAGLRAAGDLATTTLAYKLATDPNLDFLTQHNYSGDKTENDTDLAAKVGKPVIIEEMGFSTADGDRAALTLEHGGAWKKAGASAYMQWGFLATTQDNGDGDKIYGMDKIFHADFAVLSTTWLTLASEYK